MGLLGPIPPGEALILIQALAEDTGTRYFAAKAGWSFPASRQEIHQQLMTQWMLNLFRKKKDPVIDLGWPWPDENAKPKVSAEELTDLRAQLDASSAFSQVRGQAKTE